MRAAILVPASRHIPTVVAYDLTQLHGTTIAAYDPAVEFQLGLYMEIGSPVDQARQSLLEQAIRDGAEYALFLSEGTRFPNDAMLRLLAHDVPAVGVNTAIPQLPSDFTALARVPEDVGDIEERLITNDRTEGLQEVESIELDLALLHLPSLGGLPNPAVAGPWFAHDYLAGSYRSDAEHFWRLVADTCGGIRPQVDHDLSKEVGRIGNFEFYTHHAALERNG